MLPGIITLTEFTFCIVSFDSFLLIIMSFFISCTLNQLPDDLEDPDVSGKCISAPPPHPPHTPHPSLVPPVLCGNCLDRCCCCKSAPEDWGVAKPVAGWLSASKQQKQTAVLEFSLRQNIVRDGLELSTRNDLLYKPLAESCSGLLMLMLYVTGPSFRYKCGGITCGFCCHCTLRLEMNHAKSF